MASPFHIAPAWSGPCGRRWPGTAPRRRPRLRRGGPLSGRVCLLCGLPPQDRARLHDWCAELGGTPVSASGPAPARDWLRRHDDRMAVAIVDADPIGDAEDVVTALLDLRAAAPWVPVLLLSSTVRRNDFSAHRAPICDATLRSPVSAAAFRLGLGAALENHAARADASVGGQVHDAAGLQLRPGHHG